MIRKRIGHLETGSSPLSISIAMATYNGERYIKEQLDSLAKQTMLPLELVVTDDGSTDATLRIVEDFTRVSPFLVSVYRNETRLGFAENFLKAASLCQGDLIAFCDQDDIWMESKLRVCSEKFTDPEVALVIHSAQTFRSPEDRGHYFPEFRTQTLRCGRCNPFVSLPGFAMVIRQDILKITDNACRPRKVHNHDLWVWYLASSVGSIVTLADVLALYRQHPSNIFGAREQNTPFKPLKEGTMLFDYSDVADYEIACSRILANAAGSASSLLQKTLSQSANLLAYRSRLHRIRARLYSSDSSIATKVKIFCYLIFAGAYLPDRARHRLGTRAVAKDLFIAIAGFPGTTHTTPAVSPGQQ